MNNILESIEKKISIHKEDLQKKTAYLNNINEALKKLDNDKEMVISEINALQGIVHGYSESLKLMKEQDVDKVDG